MMQTGAVRAIRTEDLGRVSRSGTFGQGHLLPSGTVPEEATRFTSFEMRRRDDQFCFRSSLPHATGNLQSLALLLILDSTSFTLSSSSQSAVSCGAQRLNSCARNSLRGALESGLSEFRAIQFCRAPRGSIFASLFAVPMKGSRCPSIVHEETKDIWWQTQGSMRSCEKEEQWIARSSEEMNVKQKELF